jgi:magnesium chelatase subunit D
VSRRPAHVFPFSAIVGQEALKTALLLNAIDPRVGGVLVRGEKGTAKSTAVRALAAILPPLDVNEDCRFSCDPSDPGSWCSECSDRRDGGPIPKTQRPARIVDLPVSATEDRLVGTLDLEHALKHGERVYEPGLLAAANRAILYVDEVNLLDDHLVDTLLDAAAMGVNTVEREGVSISHPARFILVGTMNPEEGELRPQLLDRFGLCVDVESVREPESRVEIVRRRRAFEEDPRSFHREHADAERELSALIRSARLRLSLTAISDEMLYAIANLALTAGVDGHRADQVMARAAVAFAAMNARSEVSLADIARVAPLVLAHRMRRTLFDEPRLNSTALAALVNESLGVGDEPPGVEGAPTGEPGEGQTTIFDAAGAGRRETAAESTPGAHDLDRHLDDARRSMRGRRHDTVSDDSRGKYVRSEIAPEDATTIDIALDATIRAAAAHQKARAGESDLAISIDRSEVRQKVRMRKVGASIVFCVDASGSMGAANRMSAAKAAVLDLLVDAYQRRDRVSLVSFRGDSAETVLAPTASVELANTKLRNLATGGATPLAAGIRQALEIVATERRRVNDIVAWVVLVTDGRGNVGLGGGTGSDDALAEARKLGAANVHTVILDTGMGRGETGAARDLARAAGGEYIKLSALTGESISDTIRRRLSTGR